MRSKFVSYWLLCLLVFGVVSGAWAQTADRELLVQFKSEIFSGEGGAYPGVVVSSGNLDSLFTVNNVEYLEKIFTDKPTHRLVKGISVKMPDFTNYYLVRLAEVSDLEPAWRQLQFPSATIRIPHTMAGVACRVVGSVPGFSSS